MLKTVTRLVLRKNAVPSGICSIRAKHTLPDMPYGCKALEPVISGEIMELHHSKHHATYVNNLNAAEEKLAQAVKEGRKEEVIYGGVSSW